MTEKNLEELTEILKEENELYEKLLDIAEDKKETLINNNIESLFNLVENDRDYIEQVSELEERRLTLMNDIKENFAIEDDLSYMEFVEQLPDHWGEKLNPIRNKLLETLEEFHILNEENKKLIEEAVKFNKFSIDLIIENLNNNEYTYNELGKNSPRLLDKRG
mgnify:CR=1 FL=1